MVFDTNIVIGVMFGITIPVLLAYAVRQYLFMYTALKNNTPLVEPSPNDNPKHTVSILIPAHNEDRVIGRTLEFMSKLDYPNDKLEVLLLNDKSKDNTSQIAHEWASKCSFIRVIDRTVGGLGKGDVLNQGIRESKNDIIFVFDADYTPASDTLKRLVRWFDDPKVGLVQGAIQVVNKDENMLTKMIHTERCAGFYCDLLARDALRVSNQYGGTAGGFRRELIAEVGEWQPGTYCEDTDLTCRTLLAGYKVKYDVTADCGEEAPDRLKVYYKQRYRWTRGHVLCALKYSKKFLRSPYLSRREKVDGLLWLNLNCIPILTVLTTIVGGVITLQNILNPTDMTSIMSSLDDPLSFAEAFAAPIALTLFGLGATIGTVYAGLHRVKEVHYLKFAVSMIVNSYIMCFFVSTKVYIDILMNRPFKWIVTERNGVVT
jgi:cellulose synthase/poly-beta-1,6-N-acetylglucosamine synthase-like glycosyltransferase